MPEVLFFKVAATSDLSWRIQAQSTTLINFNRFGSKSIHQSFKVGCETGNALFRFFEYLTPVRKAISITDAIKSEKVSLR